MGMSIAIALASMFGAGTGGGGKVLGAMAALNSSGQACGAGFNTITNWTTQFDTESAFNPTSGIYTCPATGVYAAVVGLLLNTSLAAANTNYFAIIKRGSSFVVAGEYPLQATGISNLQATAALPFQANAGDQVIVQFLQTSGLTISLNASNLENYFGVLHLA